MTAVYTWDVFSTLDGYGSSSRTLDGHTQELVYHRTLR